MADKPATTNQDPKEFKGEIKDVNFDGYEFQVDTNVLDDVEIVELIDLIENKQNLKAIVDFLIYLLGEDGYKSMKEYFVKKDGRFKLSSLSKIYQAIFENFDPKG